MIKINFKSLNAKILLYFLLISLTPIFIINAISVLRATEALKEQSINKLAAINSIMEKEFYAFLKNREADIKVISSLPETKNAFNILKAYHDAGGVTAGGGL